ncbi:MAG: hypothetical protein ACLVKO_11345 [Dysgonomonas sp.]
MARFYNIETNKKSNVSECDPFAITDKQEENTEYASTYTEVLRIFKEALSYVDITKIIRRL